MEVTINYNGQAVAVEVTLEVYEFLGRADKIKQTHFLPPQKLTFRTKWNTTQISTAIETVMA